MILNENYKKGQTPIFPFTLIKMLCRYEQIKYLEPKAIIKYSGNAKICYKTLKIIFKNPKNRNCKKIHAKICYRNSENNLKNIQKKLGNIKKSMLRYARKCLL